MSELVISFPRLSCGSVLPPPSHWVGALHLEPSNGEGVDLEALSVNGGSFCSLVMGGGAREGSFV